MGWLSRCRAVTVGPSAASSSQMARIALISDDDVLRQDIRRLLTERGHAMVEPPARRSDQVACPGGSLDAALVDLSAGGARGLAMVVYTRINMPGTRIAVIDGGKGCKSLDRLARAVSLGADDFMKKPILESDAADVLERLGL